MKQQQEVLPPPEEDHRVGLTPRISLGLGIGRVSLSGIKDKDSVSLWDG